MKGKLIFEFYLILQFWTGFHTLFVFTNLSFFFQWWNVARQFNTSRNIRFNEVDFS